jgi:plasmid stabilization system protein ParE
VQKVRFLPAAVDDYLDALIWYRKRSQRAAAGFEAAIEIALQRIAASPESHAYCDERHRFYILKRYPFSIIYQVQDEHILVVADSSRDSAFWHRRQS